MKYAELKIDLLHFFKYEKNTRDINLKEDKIYILKDYRVNIYIKIICLVLSIIFYTIEHKRIQFNFVYICPYKVLTFILEFYYELQYFFSLIVFQASFQDATCIITDCFYIKTCSCDVFHISYGCLVQKKRKRQKRITICQLKLNTLTVISRGCFKVNGIGIHTIQISITTSMRVNRV